MKFSFTMNRLLIILLSIVFLLLLIYVIPISPSFPNPPSDAVRSYEPADSEDPLRRAYFTNLNREEVINHYKKEFNNEFNIYTPRLNYPPEESSKIIRDQTRSTYLEEIVHPLRESIYINGFEPKSEKDTIIIDKVYWKQKIIVRYIPSPVWIRILVLTGAFVSALFLINGYEIQLRYKNAKK